MGSSALVVAVRQRQVGDGPGHWPLAGPGVANPLAACNGGKEVISEVKVTAGMCGLPKAQVLQNHLRPAVPLGSQTNRSLVQQNQPARSKRNRVPRTVQVRHLLKPLSSPIDMLSLATACRAEQQKRSRASRTAAAQQQQ